MRLVAKILDDELLPDPLFVPESEEKRDFYFKLAGKAMKKVKWTILALILITVTMASQSLTSGTTIYHCFQMETLDPKFYREIDINICKNANNGTLTLNLGFWHTILTLTLLSSVNDYSDSYFFLTQGLLGFSFFYIFLVSATVRNSIKFLAYEVKLTCYGVNAVFNFCLGGVSATLLASTLNKDLTHLTDIGDQKLYFWGYPNYPETFLGYSIRLLKDLGIIGGMFKIMLKSLNDPLDFYCSLSDMMQVESKFNFQLPVTRYTTAYSYIGWVKYKLWVSKCCFKCWNKNKNSEDYQNQRILTALNESGLLLPYKSQSNQLGIIWKLKEFLGLRSHEFEKKIRTLINKESLSIAEFRELRYVIRALILHLYSKRWPHILLFSMAFTSSSSAWENVRGGDIWNPVQWIFFLHLIVTSSMMIFIEYCFAYYAFFFSLAGASFSAFWMTKSMLRILEGNGYYYLPTPYIIIIVSLIQIIALLKILGIIHLIQKAKKKRLSTNLNEDIDLSESLSES